MLGSSLPNPSPLSPAAAGQRGLNGLGDLYWGEAVSQAQPELTNPFSPGENMELHPGRLGQPWSSCIQSLPLPNPNAVAQSPLGVLCAGISSSFPPPNHAPSRESPPPGLPFLVCRIKSPFQVDFPFYLQFHISSQALLLSHLPGANHP